MFDMRYPACKAFADCRSIALLSVLFFVGLSACSGPDLEPERPWAWSFDEVSDVGEMSDVSDRQRDTEASPDGAGDPHPNDSSIAEPDSEDERGDAEPDLQDLDGEMADLPEDTTAAPDVEDAGELVPLYNASTEREPEIVIDTGDAIITSIADRGRDRHAREDQFQSYDHYLPHYWEHRTARLKFVDRVAYGEQSIEIAFVSEWRLSVAEFRAWYLGFGTVAAYSGNYANQVVEEGPGVFDNDLNYVNSGGTQFKYSYTINAAKTLDGADVPLEVGQLMEFENSLFLQNVPIGRANYYGTTFLYEVGVGGMVPWYTVGDFADPASERENSDKIDERAWLGGRTTLPYMYSGEPDNHFLQMATNLSSLNGQAFVLGRRVHHTDMVDGSHDEGPENGIFSSLRGLSGPRYIHQSCDGCHSRNGRAEVAELGEPLDRWVFHLGDGNGGPDPFRGHVLQPSAIGGVTGEGVVSLARWIARSDGLREPEYRFEQGAPVTFSARLAPQLVGMGLLEAIDESTILALEDPEDRDADGISGRARRVADPVTGELRLGRFGYKAAASSLRHQAAAALNTDMGVMTSIFDTPDCGEAQSDCGDVGVELEEVHLSNLVKYVALLGVRPQRDFNLPEVLQGEFLFETVGCVGCHTPSMVTGSYHPYAELRDQQIRPYTDLLLHDMGPGLADTLNEPGASGAEWRTPPLWGLGLGPCVTGGVEGPNQQQVCVPSRSYLHDGRARTIDEAIRWHGGEALSSREAYESLNDDETAAMLRFLESL